MRGAGGARAGRGQKSKGCCWEDVKRKKKRIKLNKTISNTLVNPPSTPALVPRGSQGTKVLQGRLGHSQATPNEGPLPIQVESQYQVEFGEEKLLNLEADETPYRRGGVSDPMPPPSPFNPLIPYSPYPCPAPPQAEPGRRRSPKRTFVRRRGSGAGGGGG